MHSPLSARANCFAHNAFLLQLCCRVLSEA